MTENSPAKLTLRTRTSAAERLDVYKRQMQFPFAIFLLTGFLRSIPRDYEEAAMIDGCGPFRILTSIITVSYTHLIDKNFKYKDERGNNYGIKRNLYTASCP